MDNRILNALGNALIETHCRLTVVKPKFNFIFIGHLYYLIDKPNFSREIFVIENGDSGRRFRPDGDEWQCNRQHERLDIS
jgi:frataxin-like iron-binding protein CyaY